MIYLIRHGLTDWNQNKKIQGREDIPLCSEGIKIIQNWHIADELLHLKAYSSPLKRATETAKICGFEPIIENSLIEMDWGNGSGSTLDFYREKYSQSFKAEEDKGLDFNFFNAESPRMVQKRAWDFIKTLREDTVLFTHKGVIRALYALATDWNMKDKPKDKIKNNCIHAFKLNNNKLYVHTLNIELNQNE